MTLPSAAFRRETGLARRWPLVWDGREMSMTALTGQAGYVVRAATGAALDSNGASRTLNRHQPRWEYDSTHGKVGLREGTSGVIVLDPAFPLLPIAFCGLLDFIEHGPTTDAVPFSIGNDGFSDAKFILQFSSGVYRAVHNNGSSAPSSALSVAPTSGQRVRLRFGMAADGSVFIHQSINGGAETTGGASSTAAPAATWGTTTRLYLNGAGTAGNVNAANYLGCVIGLGNQSQADLLEALV